MKKISLLLAVLSVFSTAANGQYRWSELSYYFSNGSLPPPYHYSFEITVNTGATGVIVYYPGYAKDSTWVYNFEISESGIKKIDEAIIRSNVLNDKIPELPNEKIPDGGSSQNLTITLPQDPNLDQVPTRIITPYYPEESYKEMLEGIYSVIKEAVPKNIWDEINTKKEEYQKSRDK